MTLAGLLIAASAFAAVAFLFVGALIVIIKGSRKGRHPIGKDVKLLRQPGEALRRRIEAIDENFSEELAMGILIPTLVFFLPLLTLSWPPAQPHFWTGVALAGAACLVSIGYRVWRVKRLIRERKDCRLGLAGERAVADALEPLKRSGYHVYHDAPAQGAAKAFNLDHVVVGSAGLFCIETKARRKYAANDGGDDYKIGFDGEALIFPNYRAADPVTQARLGAKWLETWLLQRLGRRIPATPVLAVPGWYTDETPHDGLRVLSQKRLARYLQQGPGLDPATVNLVARQLDSLCRDVPCEG